MWSHLYAQFQDLINVPRMYLRSKVGFPLTYSDATWLHTSISDADYLQVYKFTSLFHTLST